MKKNYVKMTVFTKTDGCDFLGHWLDKRDDPKEPGYHGKIAIRFESDLYDINKIKWGYTLKNVKVNTRKMGKEIFVPFSFDNVEKKTPLDAFKAKGVWEEYGEVEIIAETETGDTFMVELNRDEINEHGVDSCSAEWEITDEWEPEPEPEIPSPDIDPIIEGNIFQKLWGKYKWYVILYAAGLLTPTMVKVLNWVFKMF